MMSNEEAIHFISSQLTELCRSYDTSATIASSRPPFSSAPPLTDDDLQRIAALTCDHLLAECLQRRSNDNMTAVLILFPRMSHHLKAQQQSASRSNLEEMSTHVTSVVRSHSSGLSASVTTPYLQRKPHLLSESHTPVEENPEIEEEKESPIKGKKLF